MRVNVAHYRDQGIDYAVFEVDALVKTPSARNQLLAQLTHAARHAGLRISKSALAYLELGRITYYGTPDLVRYLADGGHPPANHTLDV